MLKLLSLWTKCSSPRGPDGLSLITYPPPQANQSLAIQTSPLEAALWGWSTSPRQGRFLILWSPPPVFATPRSRGSNFSCCQAAAAATSQCYALCHPHSMGTGSCLSGRNVIVPCFVCWTSTWPLHQDYLCAIHSPHLQWQRKHLNSHQLTLTSSTIDVYTSLS